ncbi:MAG: TonB-dependent receptor domain-containing protein, partial [Caulobacteraceae bacterium]
HIGGTGNGSNTFPVFTNKVPVYSGGSINQLSNPWGQSPSNPINENSANLFQHTLIANVTYAISDWAVFDALGSYSTITGSETGTIYISPWSTSIATGPVITGAHMNEFAPFDQYTGELRLHNAPGAKIQWNIGYYHWNYIEQYSLEDASFLSSPPVKTTTATNALYGEATYPITDKFRLIGGLRESFDHRTFDFNNAGVVTPIYADNFSHFDYRAGVEYDVAPSAMLYLTTSTAYRPGGYSSYNPVSNAPNAFKSEVNRAYEFGAKNRFFGNRVQVNADVFYYDQSNYQNIDKYTGFIPVEGGAPCANGDTRAGCVTPTFGVQAHTLGYEAQINANLTRDDVVSFSGTYLHAVFATKQGSCATVDAPSATGCLDGYNSETAGDPGVPFFFNVAGAVQPHSPKYATTISYRHTFRFASGATLSMGGDGFHTTGYWVNPVEDADRYGFQPHYWMGNVSTTFTPAHADWTVTGWVRNVSDYAVKQSVLPATSIGDPRTFGGTIAYKW